MLSIHSSQHCRTLVGGHFHGEQVSELTMRFDSSHDQTSPWLAANFEIRFV